MKFLNSPKCHCHYYYKPHDTAGAAMRICNCRVVGLISSYQKQSKCQGKKLRIQKIVCRWYLTVAGGSSSSLLSSCK
jgi:hypothetical protein